MKKGILGLLLCFIVVVSGCSSTTSSSENDLPKEIRLGYQASPNGELLAKARGSLEKKYPDTQINWIKFESGRDINNAISGGSIDFGLVGTPPGAIGVANKLPYKVYYLHDIIGESEALVVKKDAGIKSLHDLKGKKIATTFSSTAHYSLLSALKNKNIDLKKDNITLLDMQSPDILAAWNRGDIDGAYVWQPLQTNLIHADGSVLISSKEVAKQGSITGEFGIVHKDFASKYPNVVKGYISTLNESVNYYHKNPEKSAELLAKELNLTPKQSLKTMQQLTWLNKSDQQAYFQSNGKLAHVLKDTGDFLEAQKDIPSSPDLKTYQQALLNNFSK
jgi:taurine transport system substrate-binding protein